MADDNDGSAGGFCGANDEVAAVSDLRDAAGGGSDFGEGEGLDRIDDDEVEFAAFDGFGDVVGEGTAGEFEVFGVSTEAESAEFDLASGFLAGDVEDLAAILGDFGTNLHKEGRFTDTGLASEKRNRTEENAAAEDGV